MGFLKYLTPSPLRWEECGQNRQEFLKKENKLPIFITSSLTRSSKFHKIKGKKKITPHTTKLEKITMSEKY